MIFGTQLELFPELRPPIDALPGWKYCCNCKTGKPTNEFFTRKDYRKRTQETVVRLDCWCKECRLAYNRYYYHTYQKGQKP